MVQDTCRYLILFQIWYKIRYIHITYQLLGHANSNKNKHLCAYQVWIQGEEEPQDGAKLALWLSQEQEGNTIHQQHVDEVDSGK